jgi:PTH1 family peptidyl-tRNA hydrolase
MKLIVGLGNPGKKYSKTRHNVGFMVINGLAKTSNWKESKRAKATFAWLNIGGKEIELLRPMTYMNNSGYSVAYAKREHPQLKISDIYVIHDDLDVALGSYKIQRGKGPRLHKGVLSIENELREDDFWRVRVGVENRRREPSFAKATKGREYVLQDFEDDELDTINKVIDRIIKSLTSRLTNQPIS